LDQTLNGNIYRYPNFNKTELQQRLHRNSNDPTMPNLSSQKPVNFWSRRLRNVSIMVAALVAIGVVIYAQSQSLRHASFTSGYLLFGTIVFLASFNLRKKLTFLPAIGSAKFWMQLHIYVGLATFAMFGFHIGWKIPNGNFECLLAFLYLTVAFSGIYGLYATRIFPSRLTGLTEEVLFERIPFFRQRIAAEARTMVLNASQSSDVLGKFYANKLAQFFEQPPRLAYLVSPNRKTRRQLITAIGDLDRYLDADQRDVSRRLTSMVKQRDDLDYHYALQGRLKVWMFVHIGLTYSLLACGMLHGVLANAFHGGLA
jgi:hypothetical protein